MYMYLPRQSYVEASDAPRNPLKITAGAASNTLLIPGRDHGASGPREQPVGPLDTEEAVRVHVPDRRGRIHVLAIEAFADVVLALLESAGVSGGREDVSDLAALVTLDLVAVRRVVLEVAIAPDQAGAKCADFIL